MSIRNSTIRSREALAQITLQVPLDKDLESVVELVREEAPGERSEVFVSGLDGNATLTVRAWATDPLEAERLAADLRLRAHERLRAAGVYA